MFLIIYINIANWLQSHMTNCLFKNMFGVECPGCGFQRALVELLNGNVSESFKLFPALFPLFLSLTLVILQIIFNNKLILTLLKYSIILSVLSIVVSYIIKISI